LDGDYIELGESNIVRPAYNALPVAEFYFYCGDLGCVKRLIDINNSSVALLPCLSSGKRRRGVGWVTGLSGDARKGNNGDNSY
jgi:hypothetical protein